MLSIFKRRAPENRENTFNDRVRRFWNWFQQVAPEFRQAIDDGRCGDLTDVTSQKVHELFPGFAWVYGPGEHGGHSFTLSGEGVESRQLLALHWLSLAPRIEGWTFHASRQPGNPEGYFEIGGTKFEAKGMWVTPVIDEEDERIDLTIWHPEWPRIEERQRWTVVFLFLDEALGEYGTKWWIGQIRFGDDRLAESFPLSELPEYVSGISAAKGWKKYPPGEAHNLFRISPGERSFPRGDLMTLSTAVPHLFYDYQKAEGQLDDPFEGVGADYIYVRIPNGFLESGREVEQRAELEDVLDEALRKHAAGRLVGGGMGNRNCYVDLLIYDGKKSLDLVVGALGAYRLPKGATIEYFAKEKVGRVMRL
ncbi:hypothetical protein OVA24_01045 [Luteolibacter sp. SL250]|uniref:hypothetical protein n=1 Tax=Luteolibacter sp. SL250 TaxID=2995170 RepID=UPI002270DAA2|nr:hypothetical protein [Luteolibacter sp. SL250]WAC19963.1 hypothetical protein OVA24_01045 [Luteolibacter sp. SL250]